MVHFDPFTVSHCNLCSLSTRATNLRSVLEHTEGNLKVLNSDGYRWMRASQAQRDELHNTVTWMRQMAPIRNWGKIGRKKKINKFPESRWSFYCVFSESRKDFALVKGEILNKRPVAAETNQLQKYIIFNWVLHNYPSFHPIFRLHERMAENQIESKKSSLQAREGAFPLPLSYKPCMFRINHTFAYTMLTKANEKNTEEGLGITHTTTTAALVKNHKDLTCTVLAYGSCPWCDTIITKDLVLKTPLLTGKCKLHLGSKQIYLNISKLEAIVISGIFEDCGKNYLQCM